MGRGGVTCCTLLGFRGRGGANLGDKRKELKIGDEKGMGSVAGICEVMFL